MGTFEYEFETPQRFVLDLKNIRWKTELKK